MSLSSIKNPIGKLSQAPANDNTEIVDAKDATKGQDYFCPECNGVLRRRISNQGLYHFFHLDSDFCPKGGVETTLHLLAKKVIQQEKQLWLPISTAYYRYINPIANEKGDIDTIGPDHPLAIEINQALEDAGSISLYEPSFIFQTTRSDLIQRIKNRYKIEIETLRIPFRYGLCKVETVRLEQKISNIRPDLIVTINQQEYLVEVANTHFVDDEKLSKIKQLQMPCVEIDVSEIKIASYNEIKRLITQKNAKAKWLHHCTNKNLYTEFQSLQQEKDEEYIALNSSRIRREVFERRERLDVQQAEIQRQKTINEEKQKVTETLAEFDKLNKSWVDRGFPKIKTQTSVPRENWSLILAEKLLNAIRYRAIRVSSLGEDDLISKNIDMVDTWIKMAQNNELSVSFPKSCELIHNILINRQRWDKKVEHERKNIDFFCPKCHSPSMKFFSDSDSYGRECVRRSCKYTETHYKFNTQY